MLRVRTRAKCCLTAMSTVISTKGQGGLLEWLRSCPEHDWFVKIDSGSTVELDATPAGDGLPVPLAGERAPPA